jgi:hypothetical protein
VSAERTEDRSACGRYDLTDDELAALTTELIASKPTAIDDQVVCYRLSGRSRFSDIARTVECKVFDEAFPGNDAAFMSREYGPYDQASFFFLSADRGEKAPIGVLRIIRHSPAGLKTLNDLARSESPVPLSDKDIKRYHRIETLDRVWEVGTFAILSNYRRTGLSASLQLYRGMYATALEEGIDHLIAIFDKAPLLAVNGYLSIPVVPLCGSDYFSYLGSTESRAIYGYIPGFEPVVSQRLREIDDPDHVRALRKLRDGTDDHVLLFR